MERLEGRQAWLRCVHLLNCLRQATAPDDYLLGSNACTSCSCSRHALISNTSATWLSQEAMQGHALMQHGGPTSIDLGQCTRPNIGGGSGCMPPYPFCVHDKILGTATSSNSQIPQHPGLASTCMCSCMRSPLPGFWGSCTSCVPGGVCIALTTCGKSAKTVAEVNTNVHGELPVAFRVQQTSSSSTCPAQVNA